MAACLVKKPTQSLLGSKPVLMQPNLLPHDIGSYNLDQLMSEQCKQQRVYSKIDDQIEEAPVDDPSKLGRWTLEEKQRFIDGK